MNSADSSSKCQHIPGLIPLLECDIMALIGDMLIHDETLVPLDKRGMITHCRNLENVSCKDFDLETPLVAKRVRDFFRLQENLPELDGNIPLKTWAKAIHAAIDGRPSEVAFRSSGSTGESVQHILPYAYMEHEATSVAPFFPIRRIVGVMPRHHCFAFVFSLLLTRHMQLPSLHFLPLPTQEFIAYLQEDDLVVAFPFFWDAIIRLGVPLPGILPLSAGSPCPAGVMDALIRAGAKGVREIYGASELGAIGYRHITSPGGEAHTPFTLLPQWAVHNNGERSIMRRLPQDMLPLISPEMLLGTTDTDGVPLVRCPALPDALAWHGERLFRPLARKDKAVQVAGQNVYPSKIAALMATHPYVRECRVRLMRAEEGNRLKAFVVPAHHAPPESPLRAELLAWCKNSLTAHEQPKTITIGEALPQTTHGKDADW